MLDLSQVTLCCIDTQHPDIAMAAIEKCCQDIQFGQVLFFTNKEYDIQDSKVANLKVINEVSVSSVQEYSDFCIKGLNHYVLTSHVLICQWDGYVLHAEQWRSEYLGFDYIGAPWLSSKHYEVGNGGFSLRSKKLLVALQDSKIQSHGNEDYCICVSNRQYLTEKYKIQFAPLELARTFSYEQCQPNFPTFGFHGFFHLPTILNYEELRQFILGMSDLLILSGSFVEFARSAFNLNNFEIKKLLFDRVSRFLWQHETDLRARNLAVHLIRIFYRMHEFGFAKNLLQLKIKREGFSRESILLLLRIYQSQFKYWLRLNP